jgi:hypothetical protein
MLDYCVSFSAGDSLRPASSWQVALPAYIVVVWMMMMMLLLLLVQSWTQIHLGSCLAAVTAAASVRVANETLQLY